MTATNGVIFAAGLLIAIVGLWWAYREFTRVKFPPTEGEGPHRRPYIRPFIRWEQDKEDDLKGTKGSL